MRFKHSLQILAACSVVGSSTLLWAQDKMEGVTSYEVKITNMTSGQPFSPPIIVAHQPGMHLFEMGKMATPALQMLAENGMNNELVKMCEHKATGIAAAEGMEGHIMPGKSQTLKVNAKPGDVISVAMMVAATNDGFTGLDSAPLDEKGMMAMKEKMAGAGMMGADMMMKDGTMTFKVMAMDAGTEENTEKKSDTAAPDMGKGHPESSPQQAIGKHEGIKGTGDLDKEKFNWTGPVATIEIKKAM